MWNIVKNKKYNLIEKNSNPICLRVDKAIIFFYVYFIQRGHPHQEYSKNPYQKNVKYFGGNQNIRKKF